MDIRPISDLRNRFAEIEETIRDQDPVILTKNGRGAMVVMSMEAYESLRNAAGLAYSVEEQFARVDAQRDLNEEFFRNFRRKAEKQAEKKRRMEAANAKEANAEEADWYR